MKNKQIENVFFAIFTHSKQGEINRNELFVILIDIRNCNAIHWMKNEFSCWMDDSTNTCQRSHLHWQRKQLKYQKWFKPKMKIFIVYTSLHENVFCLIISFIYARAISMIFNSANMLINCYSNESNVYTVTNNELIQKTHFRLIEYQFKFREIWESKINFVFVI